MKYQKWTEKEILWLKENYHKFSVKDCVKALKRTAGTIINKAHHLKLRNYRYYKYDKEAIYNKLTDLSRPESCYLLGLLWGDGYVLQTGFGIRLVTKDMHDIEWMIEELGTIPYHKTHNKNRQETQAYSVSSKKIRAWLVDKDYHDKSQKSPTKIIQAIPSSNRHYFFRGWFDADGHWHCKPSEWSLSGAYDQDWTEIESLMKQFHFPYALRVTIHDKGCSSYVKLTRTKHIEALGDYVYKDYEHEKIGLKRKYKTYLMIKNHSAQIDTDKAKRLTELNRRISFILKNLHLKGREMATALGITYHMVTYTRLLMRRSKLVRSTQAVGKNRGPQKNC